MTDKPVTPTSMLIIAVDYIKEIRETLCELEAALAGKAIQSLKVTEEEGVLDELFMEP